MDPCDTPGRVPIQATRSRRSRRPRRATAPLQRGPGPPGVPRRKGDLEGDQTHGRIGRRVFERKPGVTDSLGEQSPEVETRIQTKVEMHFRQRIVRMPSGESSPGAVSWVLATAPGEVRGRGWAAESRHHAGESVHFGEPIRVLVTRHGRKVFGPDEGGPVVRDLVVGDPVVGTPV